VKIGIVSQWFPPEPAHIPGDLADELAARGHEVRVLTGFPNYPDGKVYPGYRQRWGELTHDGAKSLRRVPLYANHDASAVKRVGNYLSFAATSSVAALRYLTGVDVIYVYLTPATAATAPALLQKLRGIPVVIHVQDLWPESVTSSAMGPQGVMGRLTNRLLHKAMSQIYAMSAGVAVIAPTMRDIVVQRGANAATVRVVLNWADEALFRPLATTAAARQDIGHRDRCTIMYAGTMGAFQNIEASVRAASAVSDAGELDLVLVGSGTAQESAQTLATELQAPNIRFLGRRPAADMPALYGAADYQLVTLRDLPIFRGTIPSKLQAALACGSPVVVSVPGDCAALVENNGVGLACQPDDWRGLADRFTQAAKTPSSERVEMGRRARAFYEAEMSRKAGVDQLEDMLIEAADRRRKSSR
jgi:glycosyltransferase involved in cell wall biosynthesis